MPSELLPLFPLGVVLFPGTKLPLHIFEERYQEMIGDVIAQSSEFGLVLAMERGVVNTGCTARVADVLEKYGDGRMDIVVQGQRRFEIGELDQERSYLRGIVEFFDDELALDSADLRARAAGEFLKAFPDGHEHGFTIDFQAPRLSFQLAQALPELAAKQTILQMRSEDERLRRLIEMLPGISRRQEIASRLEKLAPLNGHGKHLH